MGVILYKYKPAARKRHDMSSKTTIQIEKEVWERLNARKKHGESFNDVLERLLDETEN